ncbi:MAG: hypothetical protein H6613_02000 [Ignavibacteriales bacterium]|nr:hypothetical protein [Ignavibacteriales bacterium]
MLLRIKKFKSKVNEYSDFISTSYEVLSKVVDIDDIYDEYAYGFLIPKQ